MAPVSYGITKANFRFRSHLHGMDTEALFLLKDVAQAVAEFALQNRSLFPLLLDEKQNPPKELKALLLKLSGQQIQGNLEGTDPVVDCLVGSDWLAVRFAEKVYIANETGVRRFPEIEGMDLTGSVDSEKRFCFCQWHFASHTGGVLEWIPVNWKGVAIDEQGTIRRRGLVFPATSWPWPYPIWRMTRAMKAWGILHRLTRQGDDNPLTGLIKTGHPTRCLGLQISREVGNALKALSKPVQ